MVQSLDICHVYDKSIFLFLQVIGRISERNRHAERLLYLPDHSQEK